jgi:malate dehydrogenase (oxaloacetate-decarboxylating)(NADP+)
MWYVYAALAGIAPQNTLPIQIDAGTNTPRLWGDDKYLGSKGGRVRGEAYNSFMETFVRAVADTWPHALLQFEDFGGDNAFALLDRYRDSLPSFNDDIQGTAAVVLSGLMTANRLGLVAKSLFGDFGSNKDPALSEYVQALTGNTYLFLGAGQAGVGIADLLVKAMVERESVSEQFARNRIWLMDKNGLITSDRTDLQGQPKARYAKARLMGMEDLKLTDLLEVVNVIRPSALIGVSTVGGAFTPAVLRAMAFHNIHPIIMPLSNPTSHSECTFEEAMEFTDGKVIFASGSPFPPLEWDGRIMTPGQANNCFVFPGVGLGVTLARASRVSEGMMLAAAEALSTVATKDERDHGSLYPMVTRARVASEAVAAAVAETAWKEGLATLPRPDGDMRALARAAMWMPRANVVMG